MFGCVLPSSTMFALTISVRADHGLAVNSEFATVMFRVVPWIDRPVTVTPSTRMFDAPLNDSPIVTEAPGCGRIVTVEDFDPRR